MKPTKNLKGEACPRYSTTVGALIKDPKGTWSEQTIVYECMNSEDVERSGGKIAMQWRIVQKLVTKRFVRTRYREDADTTTWDSEKPCRGQKCGVVPKEIYLRRVK